MGMKNQMSFIDNLLVNILTANEHKIQQLTGLYKVGWVMTSNF